MYTATMLYPVKSEFMEDFVGLWEDKILNLAITREGFVRMQLLTGEDEALAIGTWKDKTFAEQFMALGPFKDLMAAVGEYLRGNPAPTVWNLAAYASS